MGIRCADRPGRRFHYIRCDGRIHVTGELELPVKNFTGLFVAGGNESGLEDSYHKGQSNKVSRK